LKEKGKDVRISVEEEKAGRVGLMDLRLGVRVF
jgi:hypothetical protein